MPRDPWRARLAVRFSDLDVAGHVNNVAWLRFVHIGVSQALASWSPPDTAEPGSARRAPGELVWRSVDIRYRRTVQAVGTPIEVRAKPVEQVDGVLVVCDAGVVEPGGGVADCVSAEVFLAPPVTLGGPDMSWAGLGSGAQARTPPRPSPWTVVLPVRVTDRTAGGCLSPVAAADLLQEARHDAVSTWRPGIGGVLVVARTAFGLTQATVGEEIRFESWCSRVGRASVDLVSRGVDLAGGAVVVRSTTRIARLSSGADRSATPWSDAERALLHGGGPCAAAPNGHASSAGCGQLAICPNNSGS